MRGLLPIFLAAAVGAGCGGDDSNESSPVEVSLGAAVQVVPGAGLPAEVEPQNANNNLDIILHEGRYYLAFRTAPLHFASRQTVMYVVSSDDQLTWTYETENAMQTDLREPRFVSWQGRLWLYFAVLGKQPARFEPAEARVMERTSDGQWTDPEPFYEPGFIPWRIRAHDERLWLIGYTGGENIYEMGSDPVRIHWLTSDDGVTWGPAVGDDPVVVTGGGSETDFAFLDDGAVVAVMRNDDGDADGWGSKVCRAEAGSLGDWRCVPDLRKYDSPLVLNHRGGIWLVGRRHLSDTGHYDLGGDDKTHGQRTFDNQTAYWLLPKRCAIWRVDPEALTVEHHADLPSKGDTCFASALPAADTGDTYDLYNYTSPLDGPDVTWQEGQNGHTLIYRIPVTLPAP